VREIPFCRQEDSMAKKKAAVKAKSAKKKRPSAHVFGAGCKKTQKK
jgi:hypothetical protein